MRIPILGLCLLSLVACHRNNDYKKIFTDPHIYMNTVHELNSVVMGNNFGPIVASRNYMYAAVAGYEVVAGCDSTHYNSLAGQVRGLKSVPKPTPGKPVSAELGALLAYCKLGEAVTFPEGSMRTWVDSLKQLALDHGMPQDIYDNTLAYADTVSKTILKWSRKDNYLETRGAPEYTVKQDSPWRWVPTPPAYSSAMEPHWSTIRYLVVDSIDEFIPPPPYAFNVTDPKTPYYKEVKMIQGKGDSLSAEEAWIAEFWDDNPFKLNVSGHLMFGTKKFSPGGHWMSVTGIAAEKAKADFNTTVMAFAQTSIALFDAFIECWNIKYIYNTIRPESVINKYFDPNWRPHLQTPPFPEYTCGHCTISASAAEVLTSTFGDNFKYTDSTEIEFGIKSRTFSSFRNAAVETMHSRFYGGIHFNYSTVASNTMGRQIGERIATKLKMKK